MKENKSIYEIHINKYENSEGHYVLIKTTKMIIYDKITHTISGRSTKARKEILQNVLI